MTGLLKRHPKSEDIELYADGFLPAESLTSRHIEACELCTQQVKKLQEYKPRLMSMEDLDGEKRLFLQKNSLNLDKVINEIQAQKEGNEGWQVTIPKLNVRNNVVAKLYAFRVVILSASLFICLAVAALAVKAALDSNRTAQKQKAVAQKAVAEKEVAEKEVAEKEKYIKEALEKTDKQASEIRDRDQQIAKLKSQLIETVNELASVHAQLNRATVPTTQPVHENTKNEETNATVEIIESYGLKIVTDESAKQLLVEVPLRNFERYRTGTAKLLVSRKKPILCKAEELPLSSTDNYRTVVVRADFEKIPIGTHLLTVEVKTKRMKILPSSRPEPERRDFIVSRKR